MSDNTDDGSGSGDGIESTDDMMDEDMNEEESQGGIIEAVISFITGIFGGDNSSNDTSEDDDMMSEEGSGDMSESEGSGMDEDDRVTIESDGGSSFGGLSISLHPIDL